ncbi:MAG TPA: DUF6249 domain-containing protein [Xanthomonadales bacterium]|nr:DUF6249 domain-containing protein [Xanthomonadales bacterium]
MEELIPITMFLVLGMVGVAYFYWNHKNRSAILSTVQQALQGGSTLTPELLDRLGAATDPRLRDLRRGIVLFFIGLAFLMATLFVDEPEVVTGFRAFSMLPLMMGLGFLLVWKLTPDRP